jgi:hypothetical protein
MNIPFDMVKNNMVRMKILFTLSLHIPLFSAPELPRLRLLHRFWKHTATQIRKRLPLKMKRTSSKALQAPYSLVKLSIVSLIPAINILPAAEDTVILLVPG